MNQLEIVASQDTLYRAHCKARLGKRDRADVIRFELRLGQNLQELSNRLLDNTYSIESYTKFLVYDPKTREIQALPYADRVVQHAICDNILQPYFEKRLIYDNAACRIGKGTNFALDRFKKFLRGHYAKYGNEGYALKCDISKYFDNIGHSILKAMLAKCGFDMEFAGLLNKIIDSYSKTGDKGIPIGNQTSQYFALFYMDCVDRLVKETLQIKYYTRYMDDFVLLHPSKVALQDCLEQINYMLTHELELALNPKTQIMAIKRGIPYLGFVSGVASGGQVYRTLLYPKRMHIARRICKLSQLAQLDSKYANIRTMAIRSHLAHGNTYRFWARLRHMYMQDMVARVV